MGSVGVFRMVKIDDESYWVYTLTQTDNPASTNLSSSVLVTTTSFFCPLARIKFLNLYLKSVSLDLCDVHPINSPPHFPSTRNCDQRGQSLLDCDHKDVCKLPLTHLKNVDEEFLCGACLVNSRYNTYHYACVGCGEKFHKECVESPLEIIHPSHPFHSLQLSSNRSMGRECICCGVSSTFFYHCAACDLSMRPICAMRSIPFVEDHPKSHPHPLSFFPTQASLVCHICGLIKNLDPTYICIQCVFVIHKGCIDYPHLIRICRHKHRISFTPSLPPGKLSCGLCRQPLDNNYGSYSCSKGEPYFVHSKCALDKKVWDGKDLDGLPEEADIIDDGEPFKRIADGIILHPFHSHNLQLEISRAYDESKYCRGCTLPIYEGQFYSCMKCDYILHESCANAPRMKRHPLHPHPLTLKAGPIGADLYKNEGRFHCPVCYLYGTGFFYEHVGETSFKLDLRCALVTEPFEFEGHEHPFFIPLDPEQKGRCQMCKYESHDWKLYCTECDYVICIRCAAFPYKVRYKHDSHFLTICEAKKASDQLEWCEICEGKIEEVKEVNYRYGNKIELGFYRCDDCSTAIHVGCLLGVDIYMKPGNTAEDYLYFTKYSFQTEYTEWIKVRILLNNSLSRPICTGCDRRCRYPIVFKGYYDNKMFCSWDCIGYDTW